MADTAENRTERAAPGRTPTESATGTEPIVKTRTVPLHVDAAFSLFTDEMTSWWPFATHSVAGNAVVRVEFDLDAGTLVEHTTEGTTHTWGHIEVWEPPSRLALAWHPGRDADNASSLEVRFEGSGDGTRVVLTHTGWERFGSDGPSLRSNYDTGWEDVLAPFIARAR